MEEQRAATQNGYKEMYGKLENQAVESSKWNKKVASELYSTHEKVEKFINEELRRDVPTGTYDIHSIFLAIHKLLQSFY